MWQDFVFSIGSIIFALFQIPSILSDNKPSAITSFGAALIMLAFSVTNITLELYISSGVMLLNSMLWVVLLLQKIRMGKKAKQQSTDPLLPSGNSVTREK